MKKSTLQKLFYIVLILLSICANAQAIEVDSSGSSHLSVEIDPIVPLALRGIGAHFFVQTKHSKHVLYGFGFIYNGNMPEFMINLDPLNKNQGWQSKINYGITIEGEYYYNATSNKWFTGIQVFIQQISLKNTMVSETIENRYNTGMVVLNTGYKWFPKRQSGFYLKPWFGVAYTGILGNGDQKTKMGAYNYHTQAIMPFATIHLGYKF